MRKSLIFSLTLIGLTAMMAQILLLRELMVAFYGNELTLGAMLAAWLFWTGLGSWVLGALADRLKKKIQVLTFCQVALLFLLPTMLFLARNARTMWGVSPGEITGFGPMVISSFIILSPLCLLLGFLFALGCRIFSEHYGQSVRGIGTVYILEAIGASIGGLILNLLLIRILSPFHIVLSIGGINLLAAIFINARRTDQGLFAPIKITLGLLLLITVTISVAGGGKRLEILAARHSWLPMDLAHSENTIYGNIAVTNLGEEHSFFENGLLMFSTGDVSAAEEAAHFPLLTHLNPQHVLLIGGGVSGTLGQILKHPLSSVDYVELDPGVIEIAKQYLSPEDRDPLEDPRTHIWHIDGRLFIKNTRGWYDVIIVQLPDPSTALLNRFYSLEFFREASQILAPGGLLAFSVSSAENYISPEQAQFLGCLKQTLRLVFSDVTMVPGETCHFLATNRPSGIPLNPDALTAQLHRRGIETLFVREYYLPDRLNPWRMSYLQEVIEDAQNVRVNRDYQPVGYLYDMILWSTYFQSSLRGLIRFVSGLSFWHLVFPFGALFLLFPFIMRKGISAVRLPVLVAMASTGLSEILFQVVTVVGFQVLYGYVYYKLGLILTSFMIGLALGSWMINDRMGRLRDDLAVYIGVQLAVCLYPLLLALVLLGLASFRGGLFWRWALGGAFAFFPVVAGFIGGLQFPLANKIYLNDVERAGRTAGLIYGLDLLGACVGAFLAGAVLIPVLGILQTCLWTAVLNGCVFVLLGISWLRR